MANYDFIYMGDTWIAKSIGSEVLNYTGEFVFNDALIQAVKRKPRFILHGGDAVFTGNKPSLLYFQNQKVKKIVPSGTPFYVTPGNHDAVYKTVNGKTRISLANFRQIIGPLNFTIKAPDLKIVVLNSIHIQRNSQGNDSFVYGFTTEQLNYLRRELSNSTARFKLVSTHVPPQEWANTPEMNAIKQKFVQTLTRYHVSMVLLSHQHRFRDYTVNGIRYIISGGAGAALDTGQINHIVHLSVQGTKLTAKRVPISWVDNRGFPPASTNQRTVVVRPRKASTLTRGK